MRFFFCDSFTGEINDEKTLEAVLKADLKSEQFLPYAKLIAALTQELNGFYSIGEYVQNVNCRSMERFSSLSSVLSFSCQ